MGSTGNTKYGRCSSKYVFLEISEISQENTCVGFSF